MRTSTRALTASLAAILPSLIISFAMAQPMDMASTVRVTITNTSVQTISPPILVRHDGTYRLAVLGDAPSAELALFAEDGDASDLATIARFTPGVVAVVVADGNLAPGESLTLEIAGGDEGDYLTVAGMLVTTNDAFFAWTSPVAAMGDDMKMNGEMMTDDDMMMDDDAMMDDDMKSNGDMMMDDDMMADDMRHGVVRVYDAGSEANTELCAHIPGPPCGNKDVRVTEGAEGVITLHPGLHGDGDLDPAVWGWTDPVVTISVAH